ncbi:FadR/GntR family transcriptional regulator [Humidesulfovibrio idahonensis]
MPVRILDPASQKILNVVLSLGLQVGARLPSERRLSARLGWSRNTVREALAGLAAQGLVEIRPCSGAYLRAPASPVQPEDPTPLYNAAEALFLLAPALAAATGAQCGNGELARLEASTMQMGQALVDNNLLNVWRGLAAFYRELAALGANPLVLDFIDTLEAAPAPSSANAPIPLSEALQPFFSAHIELLHAIRSRDAEGSAAQAANSINAFLRGFATWQAGACAKPMARSRH